MKKIFRFLIVLIIAIGLLPVNINQNFPAVQAQTEEPDDNLWVDGTPVLVDLYDDVEKRKTIQTDLENKGLLDTKGDLDQPMVGDEHEFITWNFSTEEYEGLNATLKSISEYAYIWLANNQLLVNQSEIDAVAQQFDEIYELEIEYFGTPPTQGGDEKIHILIMNIKDGYFPLINPVYTAGYFDPGDVGGNNNINIFYMDSYPSVVASPSFFGTLAHEFQHMIHYNYDINEEKWLNEGLSDFAGLAIRDYYPNSHVEHFQAASNESLTDWNQELEDYGASFLFVQFMCELVERNGKDLKAFTRALVAEEANGIEGINHILPEYLPESTASFEKIYELWMLASTINDQNQIYHYNEPALTSFSIQKTGSDTLSSSHTVFDRTNVQNKEWAFQYWYFTSSADLSQFVLGYAADSDYHDNGNILKPYIKLIVQDEFNNYIGEYNFSDIKLAFPFKNHDGKNLKFHILITNKDSEISDSGLYDFHFEASSILIDILSPKQSSPVFVGLPNSPEKFFTNFLLKTDSGYLLKGLKKDQLEILIGNKPTQIISLQAINNNYRVEVQPPSQIDSGFYAMQVNAYGSFDLEQDSVIYDDDQSNQIASMLVIDRSGSMAGDPLDNAKNAAILYADLLSSNDYAGVVSYSSFAELNYGLTEITSELVRDEVRGAIHSIYATGSTSIGSGLDLALTQLLNFAPQSYPWSIVLLSDGMENTSPSVADVLPRILQTKTQVYTVGLGTVDEPLMQDIALRTGGKYYQTPSTQELTAIYNEISGNIAGRQVIQTRTDSIQQGEAQEFKVKIDSSINEAVFSLAWNTQGSDLDYYLVSPTGKLIDENSGDFQNGLNAFTGQTYSAYKIDQPETGAWRIFIYGKTAAITSNTMTLDSKSTVGESYFFSVQANTNRTLDVAFDKTNYQIGEVVLVLAQVSDQILIPQVKIEGNVTLPDGSVVTIEFFDDGNHEDGAEKDGVWGAYCSQTNQSGTYRFNIIAISDTQVIEDFQRVVTESIVISGLSDSDYDTMPDTWEIETGLDPAQDDRFNDPDQDGLENIDEYLKGTDPLSTDTDLDGIKDGDEVNITFTKPAIFDTDQGGMGDGDEIAKNKNPLNPYDDKLMGNLVFLPSVVKLGQANSFTDEFDSMISNWDIIQGNWFIQNDLMAGQAPINTWASASTKMNYSNFHLSAKMKRENCSNCSSGLVITGDPYPLESSGRWANGVGVYFTQNGYFSIFQYIAGVPYTVQAWTETNLILENGWNILDVAVVGDNLYVYINLMLVYDGKIPEKVSGKVGIIMYSNQSLTSDPLLIDWIRLDSYNLPLTSLGFDKKGSRIIHKIQDDRGFEIRSQEN